MSGPSDVELVVLVRAFLRSHHVTFPSSAHVFELESKAFLVRADPDQYAKNDGDGAAADEVAGLRTVLADYMRLKRAEVARNRFTETLAAQADSTVRQNFERVQKLLADYEAWREARANDAARWADDMSLDELMTRSRDLRAEESTTNVQSHDVYAASDMGGHGAHPSPMPSISDDTPFSTHSRSGGLGVSGATMQHTSTTPFSSHSHHDVSPSHAPGPSTPLAAATSTSTTVRQHDHNHLVLPSSSSSSSSSLLSGRSFRAPYGKRERGSAPSDGRENRPNQHSSYESLLERQQRHEVSQHHQHQPTHIERLGAGERMPGADDSTQRQQRHAIDDEYRATVRRGRKSSHPRRHLGALIQDRATLDQEPEELFEQNPNMFETIAETINARLPSNLSDGDAHALSSTLDVGTIVDELDARHRMFDGLADLPALHQNPNEPSPKRHNVRRDARSGSRLPANLDVDDFLNELHPP